MTQIEYKPYTISELIDSIYEDNLKHFQKAGNDCDCAIHTTIITILQYWGD